SNPNMKASPIHCALAPFLALLLSQLCRNPQVFGIKLNHTRSSSSPPIGVLRANRLAFEAHARCMPSGHSPNYGGQDEQDNQSRNQRDRSENVGAPASGRLAVLLIHGAHEKCPPPKSVAHAARSSQS